MEATVMTVWMGTPMKASIKKQLPDFGCLGRICRLNFRTFGGNGSPLPRRHAVCEEQLRV